jgi:hypothetical protein
MYKSLKPQPCFFSPTDFTVFREQVFTSLYLFCLQCYLFAASLLLRAALIPPYCLVKMISKLFIIQASIALIILALSSVNAAPIAPAGRFLFFGLVVREGLY